MASLLLGLGAAGLTAYNESNASKRRTEALVQGIQSQGQRQQQADELVNEEIGKLKGSNPEAERAEATQNFITQLRRSQAARPGGASVGSTRFLDDMQGAEQDVNDYATQVADTLARIQAPLRQREREQQGFGRLESRIGGVGNASASDAFLTGLRAQAARPNAGLSALSGLMGGAATGLASRTPVDPGVTRVLRGGRRVDVPVGTTPQNYLAGNDGLVINA